MHGDVVIHRLDGLVDDAVPHGKDGFFRVVFLDEKEEAAGSIFELPHRFHVWRPFLVLEVGNELSRETAPVALAEEGGGLHGHISLVSDDFAGVDGSL